MEISRDESTIMKGLAILFIALHNFFHLERFGFLQENETLFDITRSHEMISYLLDPDVYFLCNLFSFIGWCGVPLFVFLSGFGLVKKYEKNHKPIESKSYITYNYIKLFHLVLPGALFFIILQVSQGNWLRVGFSAFSLTFTNTLFGFFKSIPSAAPPYWYFSLTFQLYLIYLLFNRLKNDSLLYVLFIIFLLLYLFLNPIFGIDQKWLRYIRLNSFGWLPVFIIGILFAREPKRWAFLPNTKILLICCVIISLILLFLTNLNYYSWVLMPFVAVAFFLCAGILINKIRILREMIIPLGKISPFIFVGHPIALFLLQVFLDYQKIYVFSSPWLATFYGFLYIALFISIALFYKMIHSLMINISK